MKHVFVFLLILAWCLTGRAQDFVEVGTYTATPRVITQIKRPLDIPYYVKTGWSFSKTDVNLEFSYSKQAFGHVYGKRFQTGLTTEHRFYLIKDVWSFASMEGVFWDVRVQSIPEQSDYSREFLTYNFGWRTYVNLSKKWEVVLGQGVGFGKEFYSNCFTCSRREHDYRKDNNSFMIINQPLMLGIRYQFDERVSFK